MSKSRTTNELTILPMPKIDSNASVITQHSQKTWNPIVLKQLGKKLAAGRNSKEVQQGVPVKVEAHFQNGSVAVFLFIHEFYSLFEVHEAMRDGFKEIIKESKNISFNLMFLGEDSPWKQEDMIDAMSSLVVLSQWEPPNYETAKYAKRYEPNYGFYTHVPSAKTQLIMKESELKARATNQVRTLAMMPANKLGSKELVEFALKVGRRVKAHHRFLDVDSLKEMGAGAFCAVLQGSKSEGGIVVLKRPGKTREIALVGKGIVFDTGGHDLKTDGSMLGMHRDMTGAAVALSTFEALCKLDPNLTLSCYLAIGENVLSPEAYRPGDVISTLSGKTMEIENTDAEGRLLLIDTLTLVNKEVTKKDSIIIDYATLTGSAPDVLSTKWSIATTNKENLWGNIIKSGRKSGERVHPVPIVDEFADAVTASKIADLSQCTGFAHAEHSYAGALLSYFINPEKTHIHIDLASEHREDGLGLVTSDVTGFGVRWTFEFLIRSIGIGSTHKKK